LDGFERGKGRDGNNSLRRLAFSELILSMAVYPVTGYNATFRCEPLVLAFLGILRSLSVKGRRVGSHQKPFVNTESEIYQA